MMSSARGPLKGLYDVFYVNKKRKKFRTRVGVAMSLGVIPYSRSVKTMPRYIVGRLAEETRERFLISELIFSHPLPQTIKAFVYFSTTDEIKMKCSSPPEELLHSSEYNLSSLTPIPNENIPIQDEDFDEFNLLNDDNDNNNESNNNNNEDNNNNNNNENNNNNRLPYRLW